MSERFQYLPYIIIFAFVIYFVLNFIVVFRYHSRRFRDSSNGAANNPKDNHGSLRETISLLWTSERMPVEDFYRINTLWKNLIVKSGVTTDILLIETIGMYVLAIYRFGCFVFFFSIPFVWAYTLNDGGGAHYFTIWNIDLITLYYACITSMSVIGIMYDKDLRAQSAANSPPPPAQDPKTTVRDKATRDPESTEVATIGVATSSLGSPTSITDKQSDVMNPVDTNHTKAAFWSNGMVQFTNIMSVLYDVVGGTAIYITLVSFVVLDPHFEFWNTNFHFITSLSMTIDAIFNPLVIHEKHIVFHLTWVLCYVIQAWLLVTTHGLTNWPYFFLDTSTPAAFVWYLVLYFLDILMYYLWMGINQTKVSLVTGHWCCCASSSSNSSPSPQPPLDSMIAPASVDEEIPIN